MSEEKQVTMTQDTFEQAITLAYEEGFKTAHLMLQGTLPKIGETGKKFATVMIEKMTQRIEGK